MPTHSAAAIAQDPSLLAIKALVKAYQAFSTYSETFVRRYDLTPTQFDVIATLGNTQGLTMGEIGEKTLITKGTLTGIIDRLEKKQLVNRRTPPENRSTVLVYLTHRGERLFEKTFSVHINDLQRHLTCLNAAEVESLRALLDRLQAVF